ncbi:PIG-L deacetylase family protein [Thermocoleostomius sinensis]|uniref:PIG-L family deacetylase n=1 Tax=Thermocoleostomius sinensis A174 TaxID=2016057 RepID=A0A9E9C5I6_9CYAN|nr:PIG-L deacetylase family protein [Thermocoleostomius sinensis]WAL58219.1 PIG-L family deacetylase [Thermocoleostomius sinensis A174]
MDSVTTSSLLYLFSHPTRLPLQTVDLIAPEPETSVLVVAPHPDDETLGCGGAIALLRALGCSVRVLVMSDGTLSHPRSLKYPPAQLRALRESETLEALNTLNVNPTETTFLRLPDGSVPTPKSPDAEPVIARCQAYLQTVNPAIVFLPWRFDPHPDHRATWQLMTATLSALNHLVRIIEYPIWDWDIEQRGDFFEYKRITAWRLDIEAVLATKLKAIAAYRSQTTNLIDDDPDGFQLTSDMLKNFARPWELYLEETR